jgi:UDP-N-acetylmuramoyl-L-alanyl-D-glutamate--2,6-diaminopimelate ligase
MTMVMTLERILSAVPDARLVQGDGNRPVVGICHDSRRARPQELFVAIVGERHDARRFVDDALARGATGVVVEGHVDVPGDVAVVRVPSARAALADIAATIYDNPSRKLRLVGVTGTDGKTTTTHLIHKILGHSGQSAGRLSTLGISTGQSTRRNEFGFTTPEASDLQRALAEMVDTGCTSAVLEVSSHALAMDRVRGCDFNTAVFTNLSPEHLDYHGTLGEYLAAKARLFSMAGASTPGGLAVINADDKASAVLRKECPQRVLTYGVGDDADVTARDIWLGRAGSRFTLVTPWGKQEVVTTMPGLMNVSNWAAAATAALDLGASLDAVRTAAEVTTVEGRMQHVDCGQPFQVVVDFAHTPHALATVLRTVRDETPGRVLVMFGHAGGRDTGNRPTLGAVAASLADLVVVTSDNPHNEDPEMIAAEIVAGARAAGAKPEQDLLVRLDRREAIRQLVEHAAPGDTIVLAGKGHERYQVLAGGKVPWNDAQEARKALAEAGWNDLSPGVRCVRRGQGDLIGELAAG